MSERRFEVLCDNQRIASDMTLNDALMFIEAYYSKYYHERGMMLSVKEMEEIEPYREGGETE